MSKTTAKLWDLLERAGWTAGQTFMSVLLATGVSSAVDLPWKLALGAAAGAAIVSLLSTALTYITPLKSKLFWPDLILRLAKTFLSALLGSMSGATVFNVIGFDWYSALDLAFIATLSALAKGLVSRKAILDAASQLTVATSESTDAPSGPTVDSASTLPANVLLALR